MAVGTSRLIELEADDGTHPLVVVGRAPVFLGRDSSCDLVLAETSVSRQHAMVWSDGDGLVVRDLWSTYGTRVDTLHAPRGEPVRWPDAAPLTLGGQVRLRIAVRPAIERPPRVRRLDLLDAGAALRLPRGSLRLSADLPRPDAWLHVEQSRVVLVEGDRERVLNEGVPEVAAGRRFRISDGAAPVPTGDTTSVIGLPFQLRVDGNGSAKPAAHFEGLLCGGTAVVTGRTRVALLRRLGREALANPAGPPWVPDEKLALALWGQAGVADAGGRINTVVSRIRKTLQSAGLPRSLVTKQDGRTALSVADVQLD